MAIQLIVTCATKDAASNITGIGGHGWHHSASEAIANIDAQIFEYRVLSTSGPTVHPYGGSFLRSAPDLRSSNNLADLPNCIA